MLLAYRCSPALYLERLRSPELLRSFWWAAVTEATPPSESTPLQDTWPHTDHQPHESNLTSAPCLRKAMDKDSTDLTTPSSGRNWNWSLNSSYSATYTCLDPKGSDSLTLHKSRPTSHSGKISLPQDLHLLLFTQELAALLCYLFRIKLIMLQGAY